MKKYLLIILSFILIASCSDKKPLKGKRENIFQNDLIIKVEETKNNIKINNPETFENYYGDSSIFNKQISNYKIKDFDFEEYKISGKRFGVNKYFFSNPIIANDVVYMLDTKGNILAKNLNDMDNILWKTKIVDRLNLKNYYGGKISFYDNTIFVTNRLNYVIAVNTEGEIKWKKKLNSIPISVPVIDNNNLYTITSDNKLYALNTENGQIKWINYGNSKYSAIFGSANPVIYKNYVIASYSSGELVVLNKNTGENIFNLNLTGKYMIFSDFELNDIDSTPVIKNDILVASSNNGTTAAVNLKNMKILWQKNFSTLANILINNDSIFLITDSNNLLCLNLLNGKINWFRKFDKYKNMEKKKNLIYYKSLVLINNKIYAFNNKKEYKIINVKNGKVESENKIKYDLYSIPFSLKEKLYSVVFKRRSLKIIKSK